MNSKNCRFSNTCFLLFFAICFSWIQGSAQNIVYLDTALTANTVIHLDSLGQAYINIDPAKYNTTTDVVFISRIPFGCSDVGDSVSVIITITDASVSPVNTYYIRNTKIVALDTVPPKVIT